MSLLEVSGLSKTYTTRFGGAKVEALKSVTFSVESGEYVAVMGESGSGKTTLLNLLAALDRPTGGTVLLGGQNLAEIPEERAAAFRRDHLGFVFQDFSLLDTFSLEDNILLPLVLQGKSRGEMKSRLVLSTVFLLASVLMLYYKQLSEGYEDAARFAVMQRVGMTKRDIRTSVNAQLRMVFLLPLLAAFVHLAFAQPMIWRILRLFGLQNLPLVLGVTACACAVFTVLYCAACRLTSNAYCRIVGEGV